MTTIANADFEYIRKLVRDRTAMALSADKAYLVESRLAPVIQKSGSRSLHALVKQLRADPFNPLHQHVIEAMVTGETLFFRDSHPFESLQKFILPALLEQRQAQRRLNLWCAACSSGQEPYSIAMLLQEHFPQLSSWEVQLLASDISGELLARAQSGRYNQHEVERGLPPTLRRKYFQQQGKDWQICTPIQRQVSFQQFNLAADWPHLPQMDIIFMRNVLIYFDVATKQTILARVRQALHLDGYLFLGGGETTLNLDAAFEPVQFDKTICYRLKIERQKSEIRI